MPTVILKLPPPLGDLGRGQGHGCGRGYGCGRGHVQLKTNFTC